MKLLGFILLALSACVNAGINLTCLEQGLLSPLLGIWCTFSPDEEETIVQEVELVAEVVDYGGKEVANAVEIGSTVVADTAVKGVSDMAGSVKDLLEFDLTHNPVSIGYQYLVADDKAKYLQGVGSDYANVGIGLPKRAWNTGVRLLKTNYWYDATTCYMMEAAKDAKASGAGPKRAAAPRSDLADKIVNSCWMPYYNARGGLQEFNITDPNQKIGGTIFDLATFLIPVLGAEAAEAEVAAKGFDIAIAGAEDQTRVFKTVGSDGIAQHFATEEEAQSTINAIGDEQYAARYCHMCGGALLGKLRRHLSRRGDSLSGPCCIVPEVAPKSPFESLDSPFDTLEPWRNEDVHYEDSKYAGLPLHPPGQFKHVIAESKLSPPLDYIAWDLSDVANVEPALNDLDNLATAVIKFSPELQSVTTSSKILADFRQAFELSDTDELRKLLNIRDREGKLRITSYSPTWINNPDPRLKPFQDFVHAAVNDGISTYGKMKGIPTEEIARLRAEGQLDGNIEFFYTSPTKDALEGTDPRGLHQDAGISQFILADTEGLVIHNEITGTFHRVKLVDNAFQMLKAVAWDWKRTLTKGALNTATAHSVFGPEMAAKGRVSIVMSIFDPTRVAGF